MATSAFAGMIEHIGRLQRDATVTMIEYIGRLQRDATVTNEALKEKQRKDLEGMLTYCRSLQPPPVVTPPPPVVSSRSDSVPDDAPRVVKNFFHLLDTYGRADRARLSPRGRADLLKYIRKWSCDEAGTPTDDLVFKEYPIVLFGVRIEVDKSLDDWTVGWDMDLA